MTVRAALRRAQLLLVCAFSSVGNHGLALGLVVSVVALLIALLALVGREAKGVAFGGARASLAHSPGLNAS